MLGQKINKNRPNILQKTILKTMPQLRWILVPTWHHFGRILGAKMGPSWSQMALNIDSKNNEKIITFWMALRSSFYDFGVQLGGSRGGPVGVRRQTFLALGAVLDPRWAPDHPKTSPRRLLGPILKDLGSQIGGFFVPTWLILEGFCIPSWRIFCYCLVGCSNGWLVSW